MQKLIAALLTFAALSAIGYILRQEVEAGNYWIIAIVLSLGLALGILVADDEDKADARQRWAKLTSYFRR